MNEKHLNGLTATRGFAASMIVIFHFGLNVFPFSELQPFFAKGNMAVSYFFTLSGFIMCYTYFNQQIGYVDYVKRRLARIGPLYWFAILLSIPIVLQETGLAMKLILNLFFLQAYFPGYALSVNSPGWSLSVEFCFYLLFPFLLWLYKINQRKFVFGSVLFFVLSQIIHLFLVDRNISGDMWWHELIYYNPIGHLNAFVLGMTGYYFMNLIVARNIKLHVLGVLVLIILSLMYLPYSKHNGLLSPLFLLLIIGIAVKSKTVLNVRPLVWLGEISYGIYILQMPVNYFTAKLNAKYFHLEGGAFFWFFLVVLIIVSTICYTYLEQPLRRKINGLNI